MPAIFEASLQIEIESRDKTRQGGDNPA